MVSSSLDKVSLNSGVGLAATEQSLNDRVNSCGGEIFFGMLLVLWVGVTHSRAVRGRSQVRVRGAREKWTITRNGTH